jgi:hypothetical protein
MLRAELFMFSKLFFENHAIYEIMWKNTVELDRPQTTKRPIRFACWIPKATNTRLEFIILIAFPLQQWLHDRASLLRYTYIACLLVFTSSSPSFTVGPVGFPTVGTAAYRLIVPPCFGSHLSPPGALRSQMAQETSGRERENYRREVPEWI